MSVFARLLRAEVERWMMDRLFEAHQRCLGIVCALGLPG